MEQTILLATDKRHMAQKAAELSEVRNHAVCVRGCFSLFVGCSLRLRLMAV